jgi:hypothetical protein
MTDKKDRPKPAKSIRTTPDKLMQNNRMDDMAPMRAACFFYA